MAKTQRALVFLTFIVSCTAVVLAIVSIATENWITGEVVVSNQIDPNTQPSKVYYGLFAGTYEKYVFATPGKYVITTVCIVSENVCMLSMGKDSDTRNKEIQKFLEGNCVENNQRQQGHFELYKNEDEETEDGSTTTESLPDTTESPPTKEKCDKNFLNAGLWIMTIFFLVLSLVMGVVSATFSVVNTAINPVSQWTSIWGLYIWNGIATGSYVFTMIMWGAEYEQYVKTDVAITDTLSGEFKTNANVYIGYSFWLIFGSLFLHMANIGILFLRQYLISKQPKTPTIKQDIDKDGMIFVY